MDTQAHAIYDGFIEGFKSAGYDKFAAEGYIDVLQKIANEYDIMLDALADTQKDPNFRYKIAGFLTKVAFGEPSQDPTEGTFHDPRLIEAQTGGAITPGAPESSWKAKARELANRAASGQSDMLHNPATWLGGGGGALLGLLLGGQSQSPILKMLLPLLLGAVGAGVGNHFGSQIGGAANKMLGEAPQPTAHLNSPSLSEAAPGATIKPTSLQMGMSPEEATKATAPIGGLSLPHSTTAQLPRETRMANSVNAKNLVHPEGEGQLPNFFSKVPSPKPLMPEGAVKPLAPMPANLMPTAVQTR